MSLQNVIDRCHRINDGPLHDSRILGDAFCLFERDVPETTNQCCQGLCVASTLIERYVSSSNEILVDLCFESIEIIVQSENELVVEFCLFDPSLYIGIHQ